MTVIRKALRLLIAPTAHETVARCLFMVLMFTLVWQSVMIMVQMAGGG